MADSALNDLNYGRPGLTTYDLDNREWEASRQPVTKNLRQVSQWQLVVAAATTSSPTGTPATVTSARKNVRRLVHDHPQLVPAAKFLPEPNTVSEAVTSAVQIHDSSVGDLLAFGTVFLKKFVRPKRIAALPAGPSGNILRLVPLVQQKQGWDGDNSIWLSGPTFKTVDSGFWNKEAASIQQICFAETKNSNSFLAVRLLSKTVLFRPSLHRGRQAAEPSPHYNLPPSLLSAHPIAEVTLDHTGGSPHADVAFNPDYQFQLGIIDQNNNWSLWQIERRAKRDEYSLRCMLAGHVLPPEHDVDTDTGDGWAKIQWAGDSNTLIVCNRRNLNVINLNGETFEYLQAPPIIQERSTDWILDLRRHPHHHNRFFVLTSSRLFLIAVTTSNTSIDHAAGQAGATVISSRIHYRGDEDITLRLSVQILIDDETCLFLTSNLNELVQIYYFRDHSSGLAELTTSSDPIVLDIELPNTARIAQLHIELLEYRTKLAPSQSSLESIAQTYYKRAIPFYQCTVVLADMTVYQAVLVSSEHDLNPQPIFWRVTTVDKHSMDVLNDIDEANDFVEPNGSEWVAEPEPKLEYQVVRPINSTDRPPAQITVDQTAIYDALDRSDDMTNAPVEVLIGQFRDMLADDQLHQDPQLLMELADYAVDVSDIDETSLQIDQLFANTQSANLQHLRRLATAHVLHLPDSAVLTTSILYDILLQGWVAPLPADISVPIRQTKERLARRIAAEVILASARPSVKAEELLGTGADDSMSLPILLSNQANTLPISLPTPPQSSIPPSSPLLLKDPRPHPSDPLSRLRRHLKIEDDSPMTPMTLSPSVSELLSHWQPSTDPNTYDWELTERALRPEAPDEESQALREKERKRKDRREKRQRREDELIRAKSQTSTQAVITQPAFPRSSPGPMFGGMAMSSQASVPISSQVSNHAQSQRGFLGGFGSMNSTVPHSQVEPGRFGGRPDKKKKKGKSRVSGF